MSESHSSLKTATHLASMRRQRSAKIAGLIRNLESHADDDGFAVWTQEPLDELRHSIQEISTAEEYANPRNEGNSCEILRQVRDTFLDGGWQRYLEGAVRLAVCKILHTLATEDMITGDHADHAMHTLFDLGLNPSVGLPWKDVETQENEISG